MSHYLRSMILGHMVSLPMVNLSMAQKKVGKKAQMQLHMSALLLFAFPIDLQCGKMALQFGCHRVTKSLNYDEVLWAVKFYQYFPYKFLIFGIKRHVEVKEKHVLLSEFLLQMISAENHINSASEVSKIILRFKQASF